MGKEREYQELRPAASCTGVLTENSQREFRRNETRSALRIGGVILESRNHSMKFRVAFDELKFRRSLSIHRTAAAARIQRRE